MKNKLKKTILSMTIVSLVGCSGMSPETAKLMGQVGGAAAGAAVGSQIGNGVGKYVAVAAGTAIGAWIGGEIAKALSEKDQAVLANQSQSVLNDTPDGQTVSWVAPETGKTITMTPGKTTEKNVDIDVQTLGKVELPTGRLKFLDETLQAKKQANLRTSTSNSADNVIGSYAKNEKIHVSALTEDKNWYVVDRKGVIIGYVDAKSLQAIQVASNKSKKSNVAQATVVTSSPKMKTGMDLDKLEAKSVKVATTTSCRTMTYNMDTNSNTSSNCKAPDGAWKLS
jgi:surface antigen